MSSQKRLDFLKNQFSKIDADEFQQIVDCDPTPEKKYASWLLKLYSKSNLKLSELNVVKDSLNTFHSIKNEISENLRDINRFESLSSFYFAINSWLIKRFSENEKYISHLKNGADVVFENEDISIFKILSFEGSVHYGSNTSWCTLKLDTFTSYASKGNLYIVIPKTEKYQKYFGKKSQFHFEKNEIRNNGNTEIDLKKIICKNTELFEPFKKIESIKNSKFYNFFCIEECTVEEKIQSIENYGFEMLNFIKIFSVSFVDSLFTSFGEKIFKHIPDSDNKLISFVCNIENGLKKLLVKGEEITNEIFEKSVSAFPENILLMDCENEKLWEEAVIKESWLISRSPFIKDVSKLIKIIFQNFFILKHLQPIKIFTLEQRKEIANKLVTDNCDNHLELLSKLGEFDEEFQLTLIKKTPECVNYLVSPSKKSKELSDKLIKDKAEKLHKQHQKMLEKKRIEEEDFDKWGGRGSFDYRWDRIMDEYNRNGKWSQEDLIQIIQNINGERYFQDKDGHMFRTRRELEEYNNQKKYYYSDNGKYEF